MCFHVYLTFILKLDQSGAERRILGSIDWAPLFIYNLYTSSRHGFFIGEMDGNCAQSIGRKTFVRFSSTRNIKITILHRHALILDPAHVTAQLVLPIGILDQLRLHRESPHLFQGVPLQLHLVQDLRAYLHHFVRVQLKYYIYFSFKNSSCSI